MVLQSIRDRLNGIIAIFILGLLIIPFAFVGVSSYFTSGAVNAVALVNDQEITANDFNQAFQNYRRRMQAQMGAVRRDEPGHRGPGKAHRADHVGIAGMAFGQRVAPDRGSVRWATR